MLKFANTAEIGDTIKAYDFKPMEGRPDCYLIGKVIDKGPMYKTIEEDGVTFEMYIADGYTVEIIGGDKDSLDHRYGSTGLVPFEIDFMEFDERVTKLEKYDPYSGN